MSAPHTTIAKTADDLRRQIAYRRDRLVAIQRRGYSTARERLIRQLAEEYDSVLKIAINAGAEG